MVLIIISTVIQTINIIKNINFYHSVLIQHIVFYLF